VAGNRETDMRDVMPMAAEPKDFPARSTVYNYFGNGREGMPSGTSRSVTPKKRKIPVLFPVTKKSILGQRC
jgi:hypothetical protein